MIDADGLGDLAAFLLMLLHFGEHLLGVLFEFLILNGCVSLLQKGDGHGMTFDRALGKLLVEFFSAQGFEARNFLLAFFIDAGGKRDVVFLGDALEVLLR